MDGCLALALLWAIELETNYEAYDGYNSMLHCIGEVA